MNRKDIPIAAIVAAISACFLCAKMIAWSADKIDVKISADTRSATALEKIEAYVEATSGKVVTMDYIFICKKMPPIGQRQWGEWLEKYGQCQRAQGSLR